uniref:Cytosolic Fe-S cluster assembly factor nubp1-B (Trinotate prediction) n=1 Tax=Myxobolus squamalis TaxID=59785 RepID=A0A6B2G3E9_MYXSQ
MAWSKKKLYISTINTALIKELVINVDWGTSLDYLIVDTPPGTTDEHLSLVEMFKSCPQAGAIMVYTSQEVALIDVRKQTNFLKKTSIPLLGFIENLSGFSCPKCKVFTKLFPDSERNFGTITDVLPLCKLPINQDISYCQSLGLNPFEYIEDKNHPVITQIFLLFQKLGIHLKTNVDS